MFRFLLTTVMLGLGITIQAQQIVPTSQQISPNRSIIKHTNQKKEAISGNEIGMSVTKPHSDGHFYSPFQKAAGVRIGSTTYDLQTNTGMCRRVAVDGDKVYATWTMSETFDLAASDRGTGFNESPDNGASWSELPSDRLETNTRVGWPNVGVTESGRVFVVTHTAIANQTAGAGGLAFTWRDAGGEWSTKIIDGDVDATWARVGSSGTDIHVITSRSQLTGINGINGELHYFRSFDEGETWSGPMTFPEMENLIPAEGVTADSYFMDARGDVVAFVVGRYGGQTFLYKSMDKGDTWTSTVINSVIDPTASVLSPSTEFESKVLSDGHLALLIDHEDKIHVWFDRLFNLESNGGISYLPNSTCLMHWTEAMGTNGGKVIGKTVRMDYDGDCVAAIDFNAIESQSYGNSLVGHPSAGIDAEGNLYLAFSSMRDAAFEPDRPDRLYRDIYLIKSTDGGATWDGPLNLTDDPTSEAVYPSIQRNVGSHVHMVYQRDEFTGTAVDNANPNTTVTSGQDEFVMNEINYIKVAVEDIQTPEDLNNTCPNYFPFVDGTVPNAILGCDNPPIENFDTHIIDFPDGELTSDIEIGSTFDINVPEDMGLWILNATDADGNLIQDTIFLANDGQIQVFDDPFPPIMIGQPFVLLQGTDLEDAIVNFDPAESILSLFPAFDTIDVVVNTPYVELGAGVYDDGQLFGCPPVLEIDGFVNTDAVTSVPFEIEYEATDQAGNITEISRWVNVIGIDNTNPSILLTIDDPFNPTDVSGITVTAEVEIGAVWEDPGFIAFDNVDGLITDKVEVTGTVDLENIGDYTISYKVTDNAGNETTITRIVQVRDTTEPNISIIGPVPSVIPCGGNYIEFGANAFDDVDGSLTSEIIIQVIGEGGIEYEEVCTDQAGNYVVTYTVTDLSGNVASEDRLVVVQGECTSDDCKIVNIEDTLFDTAITLFPNPTQSQFSINFHDLTHLQTQVQVYSLVGELVYESQQMIHQNPILKVDLSDVAAGMYLVKIQTPEGSLTKKVMIRD